MTKITDEQIEALAREIGNRPYHPTIGNVAHNTGWLTDEGITIRQELMRTAMGGLLVNGAVHRHAFSANKGSFDPVIIADTAKEHTNAMLLQMAKDELGI